MMHAARGGANPHPCRWYALTFFGGALAALVLLTQASLGEDTPLAPLSAAASRLGRRPPPPTAGFSYTAGSYTPCAANPFAIGWDAANYTQMMRNSVAFLGSTSVAIRDKVGVQQGVKLFNQFAPLEATCPGPMTRTRGRRGDNDGAKMICRLADGVAPAGVVAAGAPPHASSSRWGGTGKKILRMRCCAPRGATCTPWTAP